MLQYELGTCAGIQTERHRADAGQEGARKGLGKKCQMPNAKCQMGANNVLLVGGGLDGNLVSGEGAV
jgi:hypothetical protein